MTSGAGLLPATLLHLQQVLEAGASVFTVETVAEVDVDSHRLPMVAITLGSAAPEAPLFGVIGGVHGLERIGAEVAIAWLQQLVARLPWDPALHALLGRVRILVLPVVNPGGLLRGTRANPNGVDLMRNAPVEADAEVPRLIGGHRLSSTLPWYRGPEHAPMQAEAAALCAIVSRELEGRTFALTIDCHSGFGLADRIWFPYAHTRRPLPTLAELQALFDLFVRTHPDHAYMIEPQSRHYLAHGDLWDHLLRCHERPGRVFLPLTLEMGSWLWVRKNPRQMFSRDGLFNPQIAHRHRRVLRRHLPWLDFMLRATAGHAAWLPKPEARAALRAAALARWYPGAGA